MQIDAPRKVSSGTDPQEPQKARSRRPLPRCLPETRSVGTNHNDTRAGAMPHDFYWMEDLKFAVEVFDGGGSLIEVLGRLHDWMRLNRCMQPAE